MACVRAEDRLGVEAKVLESATDADFEPNLREFVEQGCDLIIPVGARLDPATQASAQENPDQLYAIVDVDLFDTEAGQDISYDNVRELDFATAEAAFLAGYLAAGTSESGIVGTFGGLELPAVTAFMDGFLAGVQRFNEDNDTAVAVLGWDGTDGLFTGSFQDADKGKQTTKSLIDEGADVIMPVAGRAALGSVEAVDEADGVELVWIDTDGCVALPDSCDLMLTSVQKNMDTAVFDTIEQLIDGKFTPGVSTGTLENRGVGIPELSSDIPSELADKVEEYRQAIVDGTLSVNTGQ